MTDALRRLLRCLPHPRLDERAQSPQQRPEPPAQRRGILPAYAHIPSIRRAPNRRNASPPTHTHHSQPYRNQPGARPARHRLRDVRLPRAGRPTRSHLLRAQPDDRPSRRATALRGRALRLQRRRPRGAGRPRPPAAPSRRPRGAAAAARPAVSAAAGRATRLPAAAARLRHARLCATCVCARPARALCAAGRRPAAVQSRGWCAAAGVCAPAAGAAAAGDVRGALLVWHSEALGGIWLDAGFPCYRRERCDRGACLRTKLHGILKDWWQARERNGFKHCALR